MGQSNAVYRGSGGDWDMGNVTAWDNASDLTDLSSLGSAFVPATYGSAPFGSNANNFFAQTARQLYLRTGRAVRLVLVAAGSLSITAWANGSRQAMYTRMQAVLAAAGVSSVDALLWHQGEQDDSGGAHTSYASRFNAMLGYMEADGYITASTPVVVGSVSPSHTNINPVLWGLAGGRVRMADVGGLATSDGVHFTGSAAQTGGQRYAAQLEVAGF